jgi:hypothetical protein
MFQVDPESRLRLIVTATAPGFGVIEPDNATEEPRDSELGFREREMEVDGRVNVVKVVDVLTLVEV